MSSPDNPKRPGPADPAPSASPVDPHYPGGVDIGTQDAGEITKQPETPVVNQSGTSSSGQ